MPLNPSHIASQIQRLMLSETDKQRLLEEIKTVDETRLKMMADLIREHDQEALSILDEKNQEQEKIKESVSSFGGPSFEQPTEADAKFTLQQLEEIFLDPEKLAQFLAQTDDHFLRQMEEIFLKALESEPAYQEEFRSFFREVRLRKAAVEKNLGDEEKKALVEAIIKTEEQNRRLDELIAKAEKALNGQV